MARDLEELERAIISVLIEQYEKNGNMPIEVADIARRTEGRTTLVSWVVGEMARRGELNAEASGNNMGFVSLTDDAFKRYKARLSPE